MRTDSVRIYRRTVMVGVAALLALPATAVAQGAASGPCKPVFDAVTKEVSTPHHAVTLKDGTTQGESIATADAIYVKLKGTWVKSPLTPKALLAQQQENIRSVTSASCTALPGEVVDGIATNVWQAHYEQADMGASDSKVWIAKATGLPVRTEATLQAGEKVSMVTHFDYDHITAPVVK